MGWLERPDVLSWIDSITGPDPEAGYSFEEASSVNQLNKAAAAGLYLDPAAITKE